MLHLAVALGRHFDMHTRGRYEYMAVGRTFAFIKQGPPLYHNDGKMHKGIKDKYELN